MFGFRNKKIRRYREIKKELKKERKESIQWQGIYLRICFEEKMKEIQKERKRLVVRNVFKYKKKIF